MRKWSKTMVVAVAAMMMSSCDVLNPTLIGERTADICEGMTRDEVSRKMGKADFRRFANGREEWEYRSKYAIKPYDDVVVVGFEEGRVVSLDSYRWYYPVAPQAAGE